MAKEPTKTEGEGGAAALTKYVVIAGVISTREKGKPVEKKVGEYYTPADDEERESLVAAQRIAAEGSAAAMVATSGVASSNALSNATARADAAEAKVADLEKQLAARDAEIAALKAAAPPAPAPAPVSPVK